MRDKMKFLTVYTLAFFLLSAAVTCASKSIPWKNEWIPLIVSFSVIVVSTVWAILGRKTWRLRLYVCSALNSFALGFALRAWYVFRHIENSFGTLFLVSLAAAAIFLLYYVISFVPFVGRHYAVFFWILTVLILLLYALGIWLTKVSYLSTLGFYYVVVWCLVMLLGFFKEEKFYTKVLVASFSVWIVAIVILLLMLEVDSLDLDVFDFSPDSPQSKKTRNP